MLAFALLLSVPFVLGQAVTPPESASSTSRLWSTSPGANWNDSYLIGNGRVGGAVQGIVASEVIAVNEDSFWSGGELYRVNPDARKYMPEMQSLIRDGRVLEAGRLAGFSYASTPVSTRHYPQLGDLEIYMNHSAVGTNYERYLELDDATAGVYYVNDGTAYFREYLASNPADIMAIRIASNTSGTVSFHVHLRRSQPNSLNTWEDFSRKVGNDTIVIGGQDASHDGIRYSNGARVMSSGGSVYTIGDTILCDNADEAWIYFTSWTTYRKADPESAVLSDLAAINQTYAAIRSAHVADYQSYAGRVALSFGNSTAAQKMNTTAARVVALNAGSVDPELIALYFQFGRYLLLSSSRQGTVPANLQGIWNQQSDPFWGSKYTTNINVQMNYWPALVTNLAELTGPLHSLIDRVRTTGMNTSQEMYGAGGFVCHHNTDIWGDSAPQDNYISSTWWPSAGPWLVFHLMEYYRYTGDVAFLRQYYPTLKAAAEFYVGFLTDYDGYKVTNPTISPENEYYVPNTNKSTAAITLGPAMDTELLWELFGEIAEANELLQLNGFAFVSGLNSIKASLPPLRVNYFCGLQEWIHDYEEAIPGIDHLSPVWGAYPGNQITSSNETIFKAAAETLTHRLQNGGASGGWGAAWCTALAARFYNKTEVAYCLLHLVGNTSIPDSLMNNGAPAAFQIDGNLGGPAAMAEMLLQSHESVSTASSGSALVAAYTGTLAKVPLIRLLPAVPSALASVGGGGFVTGLKARGGFEVDITWDGSGSLTSATITSSLGGTVYVTLGDTTIGESGGQAITSSGVTSGSFIKLVTQTGIPYNISTCW